MSEAATLNPLVPRDHRWLGWRKDSLDPSDRKRLFGVLRPEPYNIPLPPVVDLRALFPEVYDQGETASCTAQALSGAIEYLQAKHGKTVTPPSRLFIYWNERYLAGDTGEDNGAQIRDGVNSLRDLGYAREAFWPFDLGQVRSKPPETAFAEATNHQVTNAFKLTNSLDCKVCLANGFPFVFGMMTYDSFDSDAVAASGVLAVPAPGERIQGGHAVLCVGYDANAGTYLVRNSWGKDWGQNGYFTMPSAYLQNPDLCSDFWTIRMDESDDFAV